MKLKQLLSNLKGDKVIWSFLALLALFSFMPVFSASTNLAFGRDGDGNTLGYLVKHLAHLGMGFMIIYFVHKVPYHYFRVISRIGLPIAWGLLALTLFKGTNIGGANASRWLQLPFIGISFQTSSIAAIILYIYVARYLSKTRETPVTFKASFVELWIPVFITLVLILPANFSTTALMFVMVVMIAFVGKYQLKYIGYIMAMAIAGLLIFVVLSKAFPDSKFFSRVDTWISRIENYGTDKEGEDEYQINAAKTAIASGNFTGVGPGKSVQRHFLPQSSSDFIYAIIVEEYGLVGGLGVLGLYLLLLFRFVIAAHKSNTLFGKLVVISLGFPLIFQALINMAVAVELLPVTGQTLPLISSGGSSIWMTCFALGIIINVTKKEEEIELEQKEAAKREEVLQRLIDQELEADEKHIETGNYSIQDSSKNPMDAVINK